MDRILGLVIAVGFGAALAIIYLSRNPQYIAVNNAHVDSKTVNMKEQEKWKQGTGSA